MRGIAAEVDMRDGRPVLGHDGGWTFIDPHADLAAAVDGPIQNADDLRRRLDLPREAGDAEVVGRAYRRFGDRLPDHLAGAFAFAVWDGRAGRLTLCRDYLGMRPLFYARSPDGLAFASQVRTLLKSGRAGRTLNPAWLDDYLAWGYSPDHAVLSGVQVLPPGHVLTVSARGTETTAYWRARDHVGPVAPPADPAAAVRQALAQATAEAIPRTGPLGVFLSSGLDSAAVLALAVEAAGGPLPTFTLGFAEPSYDERDGAALTARRLGCPNHRFRIEPFLAELPGRFGALYDQPISRPSYLSQYVVTKLTAPHCRVVLSGDGGDEVFAGYHFYIANRLYDWYRRLPAALRRSVIEPAFLHLPPQREKLGPINSARLWAEGARRDPAIAHLRWMTLFDPAARRALLSPGAAAVVPVAAAERAIAHRVAEVAGPALAHCRSENVPPAAPALARCQYVDLVHSLPGVQHPKVDWPSRRFDLDVRSPILDRRVVELVTPWPAALKGGLRLGKPLLRRAVFATAAGARPGEVFTDRTGRDTGTPSSDSLFRRVGRRKRGFSVPVKTYLRGPWREWMLDTFASDRSGLFRLKVVDRLVADHLAGRNEHGLRLWALLALMAYVQELGLTI